MDLAAAPAEPETDQHPIADPYAQNRARLLDIAAFLDRVDRTGPAAGTDFRLHAFRDAIRALLADRPDRARTIQLILSDPEPEPLEEVR
jgi:hypothetical protein